MNSPPKQEASNIRVTLDDVFQTACDLPPDRRQAFLDEACAGNEALRREVEELLDYFETNKTFLEKPAIQDIAEQMAQSGALASSSSPEILVGKVIGNYRILSTIVAGGMGEVYLARDLKLEVDVAIKFLRREYNDDPEWQARLNREARLQAGLKHPNIASIHYKGDFESRPFLVFEFVPGETLKARLDRGPLAVQDALPLFSQLAEALSYAHGKGVIHRDLKPSNLMVTPEGRIKVLDFGIAKKISTDLTTVDLGDDDQQTRDFGETQHGEVMGTVAYMSPEQTRGEPLDARTDVWAFGCVLYEALAGKRPFGGINTYDTLNSIRSAEPDWNNLPADTPPRIRALLRQCLTKTASQRPDQLSEAGQTIDEVHRKVILTGRLKRAAAIGAGAVLVALAVFWALKWRTPSLPSLAVAKLQVGGSCQASSFDPSSLLSGKLVDLPGIRVKQPVEIPAGLARATAGEIAKSFGAEMVLIGNLQCAGNRRYSLSYQLVNQDNEQIANNKFDGASNDAAIAQEQLINAVASELKIKLNKYLSRLRGQTLDRNQRFEQALTYLRNYSQTFPAAGSDQQQFVYLDRYDHEPSVNEAINLLEELAASTDTNSAQVQAELSQAYLYKYNLSLERTYRDKAREAYERAAASNSDLPEVQVVLGQILTEFDNYNSAVKAFQFALEKRPNDREAMLGLARAYEYDGQLAKAEQAYLALVSAHPQYWDAHNQLGGFYFDEGKYELAVKSWTAVTELSPLSWIGYDNLGTAYYYQGKIQDAVKMYGRALEVQEIAQTHLNLGAVLFFQGDYQGALANFDKARRMNPRMPSVWGSFADACNQTKNCAIAPASAYDEAILLAERVLEVSSKNSYLRSLMAEWQAKKGSLDEALKNISQATSDQNCDSTCLARAVIVYSLAAADEKQQGKEKESLFHRAKALKMLDQALTEKYPVSELERTPELGEFTSDPEFRKIIFRHRQAG